MSDYKPKGKTICPHVNRRCAGALLKMVEFAIGVSEDEPTAEEYDVVAAFSRNLAFEVSRYDHKRKCNEAKRELAKEADEAINKEQQEIVERYVALSEGE